MASAEGVLLQTCEGAEPTHFYYLGTFLLSDVIRLLQMCSGETAGLMRAINT